MKQFARFFIYNILGLLDNLTGRCNNVVIYCYHNISNSKWAYHVSPPAFKRQMEYLSSIGEFVTINDIQKYIEGKKKLNKNSFVITFDDGYRGVKNILPVTQKQGISPAIFIHPNKHLINRSEVSTKSAFLSKREVKMLSELNWHIGSHGLTHKTLTKLSTADAIREIRDSKKLIEKKLGKRVTTFAYPHGKYDDSILSSVKKEGYKLAFSVDDDLVLNTTNKYAIPRVGVMGDHTDLEFKYLATPSVLILRKLIKNSIFNKYI